MALSAWAMALSKRSSPKQISLFPSEAAGLSAALAKPLPSYLKDHRKRLRERFDRAGLQRCRIMNCWNWFCFGRCAAKM